MVITEIIMQELEHHNCDQAAGTWLHYRQNIIPYMTSYFEVMMTSIENNQMKVQWKWRRSDFDKS